MNRVLWTYALAMLLSCNPDYQSGSTECSPAGTCPKGFVCGGGSSVGAQSVCYAISGTPCDTSDVYYCPSTASCWSAEVACSTVVDCGNGNASACVSDGYTPDCSGSGKCTKGGSSSPGTGGSGGGGGGSGGSTVACTPSATADACTICLDQSCCSQWDTCEGQAACANLVNCINACSTNDTTCFQNCESSYSAGVSNLTSFVNCGDSYCQTSCN